MSAPVAIDFYLGFGSRYSYLGGEARFGTFWGNDRLVLLEAALGGTAMPVFR